MEAAEGRMLLRLEFVQVVERVLQWHASHAAEARLPRELLQLPFWQTHRTQSLAMPGERGGHAIEHTEAIEQAAQRPGIAFQVLCTIDVQAHIASIRAPRSSLACTSGMAGSHTGMSRFSNQPAVKRSSPSHMLWS